MGGGELESGGRGAALDQGGGLGFRAAADQLGVGVLVARGVVAVLVGVAADDQLDFGVDEELVPAVLAVSGIVGVALERIAGVVVRQAPEGM
jgi:hypothetical protein